MSLRILAAGVFLFAAALSAQDAAKRPSFEVASIKPHVAASFAGPYERAGIDENAASVRIDNLPLRTLIEMAYGLRDFQLAGPAWLGSARFDIEAKPPSGYTHAQLSPLLQTLLEDRFRLTVHHESKRMTSYRLTLAKGGPKFREAAGPRGFFTARPGLISGTRVSMGELVNALVGSVSGPVVDKTGLKSAYDLQFTWFDPAKIPDEANTRNGPSFFTALQEQLGLKMVSGKTRVDVIVVDRVERTPTEN